MTIPCVEELERQLSDAKARLNWRPAEPTIKYKPEPPAMKSPREEIRIDTVLARELETERARSERLELEVINLRALVGDFEEHDIYPPNINACIRDVKNYLKQLQHRKP